MKRKVSIYLTTALIAVSSTAYAQNECDYYVVENGDTLRNISFTAYGDESFSGGIYTANKDTLGTGPDAFSIGVELYIPCYDELESIPADIASANATGVATELQVIPVGQPEVQGPQMATAETPQPLLTPVAPTEIVPDRGDGIRIVAASNFAPFTDEALADGGLYTELVSTALTRVDESQPFAVEFVSDWSRQLDELLPSGEYDLSFPWYRPDCEHPAALTPDLQAQCDNFNWSEPYFDAVIGMYARANSPLMGAGFPQDLFGTRICRPEKTFTFDLRQMELVEPNITLVRGATPLDCLQLLRDGKVDIASMNVILAEDEIQRMGAEGLIAEIEPLATIQTLHVVAAKSNPEGQRYLAILNEGIREISASGEWVSIVSRHLGE